MEYLKRFIKRATIQGWLASEKKSRAEKLIREPADVAIILKRMSQEALLTEGQIAQLQSQLEEENSTMIEMPVQPAIFYMKDLHKSYKTPEGSLQILKGVTLTIYRSEIMGILGFSGSGKSTLLNILGLLATPDTGSRIYYNGVSYDQLTLADRDRLRKQKFGFIFQESHLLSHLSAVENVSLPMRLQNFSDKESLERAKQMLINFMNKTEKEKANTFFTKKPSQLSGGQKQRVAAARAMVHEPDIIFADEPTGSLDFDTGQMVMEILLKAAKEKKTTVLLVTHNPSQARSSCNRFIWMENGLLKNHLTHTMDSTIRLMKQLSGKDFKQKGGSGL